MQKRYIKILLSIALLPVLLIQARPAFAQTDITNNGILYITSATDTLFINGAFTNGSAAAFTNNGKFQVKKDLNNDQASMAIGTGTLYLNGSTGQNVSGSQIFKTYNLVTANSAGFKLNNDLSVSGTHTFTSGLIQSSGTPNYLVYQAGSSYTGDNDSRHVNGWVKKFGITDFIFPIGDATYERTVSAVSLSAVSEINAAYYKPTTNVFNLFSPLVEVDENEYWQVDKISGGTVKVKLNWDNGKVAFNNVLLSEITAAQYTSSKWISIGGVATGAVATTGTITSNSISTIGPVTFGFTSYPLPLQITSFTGTRGSNSTFLHFVVENEQHINHYEIERGNTANVFTTIASITAHNTGFAQQYDFEDASFLQDIAYYRVKSVGMDGKWMYSGIIAITNRPIQSSSFLVLNPVRTAITVFNKTGKDGSFDYRLFNAAGLEVMKGNLSFSSNGSAVLPLPIQISGGVYVLQLSNEQTVFRQKLLVEK